MREVDIFDEENSMTIEDDFAITTFEFLPEQKRFKVDMSIKDDYHHNESTIEYKISVDPIELQMRTIDIFHRYIGGEDWSIRDGVVLESEIKKDKFQTQERIDDLKKEVEWSKASIFGNPEVNLYILSKHPEIISKDEYRKFLRQSVEKLKLNVPKVEEAVKNDTHGLQLHTGEYGTSIWYPDTEELKAESEKYWKLSEDERNASEYGKKLKYIEEFKDSLFNEDSPKYVGVSELEFRNSKELIEYLDSLLDKKPTTPVRNEVVEEPTKKNGNGWKWLVVIGISIIALSWGIWTAIGAFILGVIILNVLSHKN